MIPKAYLPLPWWRRWIVRVGMKLRWLFFGQGYWFLDLETNTMLCTAQMWHVFDAIPIDGKWEIVEGTFFRSQLASEADRDYVDHAKSVARLFKTVMKVQFTIISQITGNTMPVEGTLQFEYARDTNGNSGKAYAMWGYARALKPKMFGLAVRVIQERQRDELMEEQKIRDRQLDVLLNGHGQ